MPTGVSDLYCLRWEHVHVDIHGALQWDPRYIYILTCIHSFSLCPEATQFSNITVDKVERTIVAVQASLSGVPESITTGRSRQFESSLCGRLTALLV